MADQAVNQLIKENVTSWADYNDCLAKEGLELDLTSQESPIDYLIRSQNSARHMADGIYRTDELSLSWK